MKQYSSLHLKIPQYMYILAVNASSLAVSQDVHPWHGALIRSRPISRFSPEITASVKYWHTPPCSFRSCYLPFWRRTWPWEMSCGWLGTPGPGALSARAFLSDSSKQTGPHDKAPASCDLFSPSRSVFLARRLSELGVQDKTVFAVAKKSWIARAGGGRSSLEEVVGHRANGEYCSHLTRVP